MYWPMLYSNFVVIFIETSAEEHLLRQEIKHLKEELEKNKKDG